MARSVSGCAEFKLAILLGSQATGNATGNSDIDLALLADAPISSTKKLQLVEQIGAKFGRPNIA
ncbi:MAG: nucleotidyltransferase domain-containing protein [Gammaproteobacteria bacterium]|nr:nucleotidyltransferase domain-containing protein [Gammaproteobacteria bacterium]